MATFVRCHAQAAQCHNDVTVLHLTGSVRPTTGLWELTEETHNEVRQGIPTYRVTSRLVPIKGLSLAVLRSACLEHLQPSPDVIGW